MMPKSERRPRWLELRSSEAFITTIIVLAVFTDVFLYGLIVPVIPAALRARLGVPDSESQKWTSILLGAYAAGTLVGSPILGYWADRSSSRRWPFVGGLIALLISTVLFLLGNSPSVLVFARILQGISAASVWVVSLALMVDTVGNERIGESMGVISIAMTAGLVSGPFLGGLLYDNFGYEAVFIPAIFFIFVDTVFRLFMIEKKVASKYFVTEESESLHNGGANYGSITSSSGWESATPSISESNASITSLRKGSGAPHWSQKLPKSIFLLSSKRLVTALVGTLLSFILYTAIETTLPIHLMDVFHWSATMAGLALLAFAFPSALGVYLGRWVDRSGARVPVIISFVLMAPCFAACSLLTQPDELHAVLLFGLIFALGVCFATMQIGFMSEISTTVTEMEQENPHIFEGVGVMAQGYALFNMAYAGGSLVGPFFSGWVKMNGGWGVLCWVMAAMAAASTVPSAIWVGQR